MPKAFAPFGLLPVAAFGEHANSLRPYALPSGATCPALAKGSPVKMAGGVLDSVGAGGADPLLGSCGGFAWVDSTTKRPNVQSFVPGGTTSGGVYEGESRITAYVYDNPGNIFIIQADASVSAGDVDLNFNVTASGGDADLNYGVSRYTLQASSRTSAATGALRLLGVLRIVDNAFDDPFPICVVKLNGPIMAQTSGY